MRSIEQVQDVPQLVDVLETKMNQGETVVMIKKDVWVSVNVKDSASIMEKARNAAGEFKGSIKDWIKEAIRKKGSINQIQLVGESGGGKSHTARFIIMEAIDNVVSNTVEKDKWKGLAEMAIELIELFGVASTPANQESSRYGLIVAVTIDPDTARIKSLTFKTLLRDYEVITSAGTDQLHILREVATTVAGDPGITSSPCLSKLRNYAQVIGADFDAIVRVLKTIVLISNMSLDDVEAGNAKVDDVLNSFQEVFRSDPEELLAALTGEEDKPRDWRETVYHVNRDHICQRWYQRLLNYVLLKLSAYCQSTKFGCSDEEDIVIAITTPPGYENRAINSGYQMILNTVNEDLTDKIARLCNTESQRSLGDATQRGSNVKKSFGVCEMLRDLSTAHLSSGYTPDLSLYGVNGILSHRHTNGVVSYDIPKAALSGVPQSALVVTLAEDPWSLDQELEAVDGATEVVNDTAEAVNNAAGDGTFAVFLDQTMPYLDDRLAEAHQVAFVLCLRARLTEDGQIDKDRMIKDVNHLGGLQLVESLVRQHAYHAATRCDIIASMDLASFGDTTSYEIRHDGAGSIKSLRQSIEQVQDQARAAVEDVQQELHSTILKLDQSEASNRLKDIKLGRSQNNLEAWRSLCFRLLATLRVSGSQDGLLIPSIQKGLVGALDGEPAPGFADLMRGMVTQSHPLYTSLPALAILSAPELVSQPFLSKIRRDGLSEVPRKVHDILWKGLSERSKEITVEVLVSRFKEIHQLASQHGIHEVYEGLIMVMQAVRAAGVERFPHLDFVKLAKAFRDLAVEEDSRVFTEFVASVSTLLEG